MTDALPLLRVEELRVALHGSRGPALGPLSLAVPEGGAAAAVGAAGAGKSLVTLALMGLIPRSAASVLGVVELDGQPLLAMRRRARRAVWGTRIALAMQDPAKALHPRLQLGRQLADVVRAHSEVSAAAARDRAIDALELVGLPEPQRLIRARAAALPLELAHRAQLALATIAGPALLIVDEPGDGLDAEARGRLLAVLDDLCHRGGIARLVLTRDRAIADSLAPGVRVSELPTEPPSAGYASSPST